MRKQPSHEVHFTIAAPVPPERVLDALTDFTPRRPELWPALDPAIYRVDEVGPTSALVREGQRRPRLWALESYDWSEPDTVTWTVRESNFCAPGSYMSASVEPDGAGGSTVWFRWNRTGTTLKGRLIVALVRRTGGRPLAGGLSEALAGLGQPPQAGGTPNDAHL